ncbi:DHA2 family efflux MFS transporter permease subunit [Caldimonas thermodepolymerans]|uniref:MFS transporter n=1 Tax=Caldimonas thermodepolymerans TaxID=215580 RepID=A0A2S5T2X8_9BURK|nr:DHA2 family efflux MFS transporter permease subunit [Caldimonas thermodepolymerans]PPE69227.1 MFS transporter [Caldimonas thermodepolymerans]QPC32867.1 DHA2 family efflux MFS transporter permease subunit [Caldimonas thermodepolymerans]RDI03643.1 EmrB/QacA subfamily drug resistance transporter [Caldimonas thermodepolymerans]
MKRLPEPRTFDALTERHGERYKWLLLLVVGIGTVAGVLSTSVFNVAVVALSSEFGLGQDRVQWAMTGFMAAMTLSMLPAAWLLDRIGFRRTFIGSILLLAAASLAGSLATAFWFVVVARVLQGLATGVLQPLAMLVVLRMFPPQVQGRASGVLVLGISSTPAIAPAIGGVLVDRFGWEAIFLLNLPFCAVALAMGLFLLPLPREIRKGRFDFLGALLLSVATLALVEGVASLQGNGLLDPWTLGHFAVALVLTGGFAAYARRAEAPLIDLSLFRQRTFSMGTIVAFSYGFGLFGSTYLIPVYLQHALGYSAAAAGGALIPSGIALTATTPVAGRLADRFPPKWITTIGLVLFGSSFFLFFLYDGRVSYAELIAITLVGRIGLGMILPALNLATVRELPAHRLAQSTVVVSYVRQLGGVIGIAAMAVFVEWRVAVLGPSAVLQAYAQSFCFLGLVILASVVAACLMQHQPAEQRR